MAARQTAAARHGASSGRDGRLAMWAVIALLLLLPAIAMRFTREVSWTAFDFAAAAVLLVGGGLAYEVVARLTGDVRRRVIFGLMILGVVLLIWAQGAVGIV